MKKLLLLLAMVLGLFTFTNAKADTLIILYWSEGATGDIISDREVWLEFQLNKNLTQVGYVEFPDSDQLHQLVEYNPNIAEWDYAFVYATTKTTFPNSQAYVAYWDSEDDRLLTTGYFGYTIRNITFFDDSLTQPVPEPATMLLLGFGLIGLAGYGRKKFFKK